MGIDVGMLTRTMLQARNMFQHFKVGACSPLVNGFVLQQQKRQVSVARSCVGQTMAVGASLLRNCVRQTVGCVVKAPFFVPQWALISVAPLWRSWELAAPVCHGSASNQCRLLGEIARCRDGRPIVVLQHSEIDVVENWETGSWT